MRIMLIKAFCAITQEYEPSSSTEKRSIVVYYASYVVFAFLKNSNYAYRSRKILGILRNKETTLEKTFSPPASYNTNYMKGQFSINSYIAIPLSITL